MLTPTRVTQHQNNASLPTTPMSEDGRKRQSKRDEAIRKKLEADLSKKRTAASATPRPRNAKRPTPGTVMALKPASAVTVGPEMSVKDASQLMAAKREDCVLVIDEQQHLAGIFTAKDLAFRVVGMDVHPQDVCIRDIMTPNPMCARQSSAATEALELMVKRGFRHLPVLDDDGDVVGILDITKCFHEAMEKLERAYASSRKLYDALEGVNTEWGSGQQPPQMLEYLTSLRERMRGPELGSGGLLDAPVTVTVRTSVRDAAVLMREHHTTAVLVMDGAKIAGIFTSKDVVLRVIAAGLEPTNCSVVRVMTPHPDTAPESANIQEALRKMYNGRYLNLPVVDEGNNITGMVDVLKLTHATLDQINQMSSTANGGDGSEGPMWNRFWNTMGDETESVHSENANPSSNRGFGSPAGLDIPRGGQPFSNYLPDRVDSPSPVLPNDSASGFDEATPSHYSITAKQQQQQQPPSRNHGDVFTFKIKTANGSTHRVQAGLTDGLATLKLDILERLTSAEEHAVGGPDGMALSFIDEEGDVVGVTSDKDVQVAILIARRQNLNKVDLLVHRSGDPESLERARDLLRRDTAAKTNSSDAASVPTATATTDPTKYLLPAAIGVLAAAIIVAVMFRPSTTK